MNGAGARQMTPQTSADKSPIAIICGGGAFPAAIAEIVQKQGRGVYLFLLEGFADDALMRFPHEWVQLGSLAKYVAARKKHGLEDIVFIGSVIRPRIGQLGLDWRAAIQLPRLLRMYLGGDNKLLSEVAKVFEEQGYKLRGAHEVAPEILIPAGMVTTLKPDARASDDIHIGLGLLRAIDAYDVGQAVVVAGKRVVAIEGAEGTEGLLARVAEMRHSGRLKLAERDGVLVKIPKPSQDRRIDMPAIGNDTVAQAKAAGLVGIAVEAQGALVLDVQKFIEAAEAAGIFVTALPPAASADR